MLVGSLRGIEGVTRIDDALRVAVGTVPTHEINRQLVEAGIAVNELRPERASLEEVFFELTEDEVAA
jgi:hypothetical protein